MVIDFDPKTQTESGLYNTIKEMWREKRQMLYSEVETMVIRLLIGLKQMEIQQIQNLVRKTK